MPMKNDTSLRSRRVFNFRREYTTILIIILILGFTAIKKPGIFTVANQRGEFFQSILLWLPLIVTVAMGMMMVICLKNVDVSVGSIVGISGMVVGYLFKFQNAPFWVGVVMAIAVGLAAGAINGLFISYLGIPFLVVTLATMNIWRGLALIITGGTEIDNFSMPEQMSFLIQKGPIPGKYAPWLVWISLLFVIIMVFVMRYTHFGREVYAIGSNESAAKFRGINVKKVKFMVYTLTGMFSGISGLMYGSRYGYFNPADTGNGLEFMVISATVIGGVSMSGGTGNILGAFLGCLLISTVQTVTPSIGFSSFYNKAIYGLIIIISLLIDKAVQSRRTEIIMRKGVTV